MTNPATLYSLICAPAVVAGLNLYYRHHRNKKITATSLLLSIPYFLPLALLRFDAPGFAAIFVITVVPIFLSLYALSFITPPMSNNHPRDWNHLILALIPLGIYGIAAISIASDPVLP